VKYGNSTVIQPYGSKVYFGEKKLVLGFFSALERHNILLYFLFTHALYII